IRAAWPEPGEGPDEGLVLDALARAGKRKELAARLQRAVTRLPATAQLRWRYLLALPRPATPSEVLVDALSEHGHDDPVFLAWAAAAQLARGRRVEAGSLIAQARESG